MNVHYLAAIERMEKANTLMKIVCKIDNILINYWAARAATGEWRGFSRQRGYEITEHGGKIRSKIREGVKWMDVVVRS